MSEIGQGEEGELYGFFWPCDSLENEKRPPLHTLWRSLLSIIIELAIEDTPESPIPVPCCTAHVSRYPDSSQQQNTRKTRTNKNIKNALTRFLHTSTSQTRETSPFPSSSTPARKPAPIVSNAQSECGRSCTCVALICCASEAAARSLLRDSMREEAASSCSCSSDMLSWARERDSEAAASLTPKCEGFV